MGLGKYKTAKLKELLDNPEGLILVTGPTGSGKTTTLYTCLAELRKNECKILTAEDPIEKTLSKINQKQVHSKMNFSDYARAFLRQDPNAILIGEIRDNETADMALRASQNGCLVLSSLHTADAIRSLSRMYALGADWDLLINSLSAVLNQRLLRKICSNCKEEYTPDKEVLSKLGIKKIDKKIYRGKGCKECYETGYAGRIAIYEMLIMNDDIIYALRSPDNIIKVKDALHKAGYKTLFDDAIKKVMSGQTTLDEVLRSVPYRVIHSK